MKELDFTIVTPSYNYAQYVREMLDSVVEQKGIAFEHLVYDAGSTDGTLDILREYEHVNLTVEPDKGMSDAINKGFRGARGTWVMWLNTDDRLKPDALKRVKDFAETHQEADIVYGAWDVISHDGGVIRTMGAFPYHNLIMIHRGCFIASTSTFYRRRTVIEEGHYLNPKFKYVMDGEYYARLALAKKKYVYMCEVLADFRVHDKSLTLRHTGSADMDGVLAFELQRAEGRAIRRRYGVKLFKNDHLNNVTDCVLFYFLGLVKKVLRLKYRPR